jgi:uncharacterized protein YndB with AHSA1/START domain
MLTAKIFKPKFITEPALQYVPSLMLQLFTVDKCWKMKTPDLLPITVRTTVKASLEKVWECWTMPEHIMQWCQASPDWHAPAASNDLRTGGKFSTTMAAKDGSMSFNFEGVYTLVNPCHRIEYALSDDRKVTVQFLEEGGQAIVVESFDPENINPLDMQQAGWQAILDSFKQYAEQCG